MVFQTLGGSYAPVETHVTLYMSVTLLVFPRYMQGERFLCEHCYKVTTQAAAAAAATPTIAIAASAPTPKPADTPLSMCTDDGDTYVCSIVVRCFT